MLVINSQSIHVQAKWLIVSYTLSINFVIYPSAWSTPHKQLLIRNQSCILIKLSLRILCILITLYIGIRDEMFCLFQRRIKYLIDECIVVSISYHFHSNYNFNRALQNISLHNPVKYLINYNTGMKQKKSVIFYSISDIFFALIYLG